MFDGVNFEHLYRSPVEIPLDSVAAEIFERVRHGKVRRVAIDALGDLERCSIDLQRFADFMHALIQWFAVENVTRLITYELPELYETSRILNQQVANMTDNLILLGLTEDDEMRQTVRIIKTRGNAHDNRRHFLSINEKGASVTNK